jgi:hypothetical protein
MNYNEAAKSTSMREYEDVAISRDERPRLVRELDSLDNSLTVLAHTVAALTTRLVHVRRDIDTSATSVYNIEEPSDSSETVRHIVTQQQIVNSLQRDLDTLLDDLEV